MKKNIDIAEILKNMKMYTEFDSNLSGFNIEQKRPEKSWGKVKKQNSKEYYELDVQMSYQKPLHEKTDKCSITEVRAKLEEFPGKPYKLTVDLETSLYKSLIENEQLFKETKNPIYLMEAFIKTNKAELYPPLWAINFIAGEFEKYIESLGQTDLSKQLGIKRVKGKDSSIDEYFKNKRNEKIFREIFLLKAIFQLPVEVGSKLVLFYYYENKCEYEPAGSHLQEITYRTVQQYFSKWKKKFVAYEDELEWSNMQKKKFIRKFPILMIEKAFDTPSAFQNFKKDYLDNLDVF